MCHLWSCDLACLRILSRPSLAFTTKASNHLTKTKQNHTTTNYDKRKQNINNNNNNKTRTVVSGFSKINKKRRCHLIRSSCYIFTACNLDFERGIDGWKRTGTVFNNQPTFGDNPTSRNRGQPSNHQGDWWIGGNENRPSKEAKAGAEQGDGPIGTLTTPSFRIIGRKISFLIGGGCDVTVIRAELLVDNAVRSKSISPASLERFQDFMRGYWC